MSKRGLTARLYVANQTLILVNMRLPKGILAAANAAIKGRQLAKDAAGRHNKTAHLRVQTGGLFAFRLMGALA
jgi:hypothetical protein